MMNVITDREENRLVQNVLDYDLDGDIEMASDAPP